MVPQHEWIDVRYDDYEAYRRILLFFNEEFFLLSCVEREVLELFRE